MPMIGSSSEKSDQSEVTKIYDGFVDSELFVTRGTTVGGGADGGGMRGLVVVE